MRYRGRAPLRIDFGGGWTDVPVYAQEEGGAVLNAAITRYVTGFLERPSAGTPWVPLLRRHPGGTRVSYGLELPAGAGIGASAAQTVLWVALIRTAIANTSDRREIAGMACRVAASLGILGGKQDEYASALGGIGYYTFGGDVEAERVTLPQSLAAEFRERLVLVYSGQSRISADIHEHVWGRYRAHEPRTVQALAALKRLATEMRTALLSHDLDGFAQLLNENWSHQKALHPSVTTPLLDDIFDVALRHGALGGKACGAGGGGCLIFLTGKGQSDRLKAVLAQHKLRHIDFDFDTYGVFITKG